MFWGFTKSEWLVILFTFGPLLLLAILGGGKL